MNERTAQGFTLIELLVTISIIVLVSSVGLVSYIEFNRRQIVEQAAKTAISDLHLAQALATNQEKPESCLNFQGYFFNRVSTTNYTIDSMCNTSTQYKSVTMSDIVFSGFTMVKFKILGQKTEFIGGNSLTITGKTGYVKTIIVGVAGDITAN